MDIEGSGSSLVEHLLSGCQAAPDNPISSMIDPPTRITSL